MNSVKFELNIDGLRELMQSSEMQGILDECADKVAGDANSMGNGAYGSSVRVATYVAIGTAYPSDRESAIDNSNNNTLVKALGSSGLPMEK